MLPSAFSPSRSQFDVNAMRSPFELIDGWSLVQPSPVVSCSGAEPSSARKISRLPSAFVPAGSQSDCQAKVSAAASGTGTTLAQPVVPSSSVIWSGELAAGEDAGPLSPAVATRQAATRKRKKLKYDLRLPHSHPAGPRRGRAQR